MAGERNNDDVAAALHGLNGGQGAEPTPAPPPRPAAAAPQRPASPMVRPASPVAPPTPAARPAVARPAAAPATPQAPRTRAATPTEQLATPEAAALEYRTPQAAKAAPKRRNTAAAASLRQTMIPILLTMGLMLFVMAIARWLVPDDAPLAQMPVWGTAALVFLGLVMFGLAVVNMMAVRHDQHQRQLQATSGAAASR